MTDRRRFTTTLLVSVVLHAVLAAVTWRVDLFPPLPPAAQAEPTVELFLVPDDGMTEAPDDQPTRYTEIPERAIRERPEHADFLAMHDSRAADRVPGGEDDQAGARSEGTFPQVAIAPENLAASEGVSVADPLVLTDRSAAQRSQTRSKPDLPAEFQRGAEADDRGEVLQPKPMESTVADEDEFKDWIADPRSPSILKQGRQAPPGDRGFDFFQQEQGRIHANVDLDGDFSLSTYEWNFAPWMRRFVTDLHRSWISPYAYRLGIIDGYTRIRLVVELDGRVSGLDVVEEQGHESLHTASVAALRAFAPYPALPPDFPEDQLVINLQLHYPAWKR